MDVVSLLELFFLAVEASSSVWGMVKGLRLLWQNWHYVCTFNFDLLSGINNNDVSTFIKQHLDIEKYSSRGSFEMFNYFRTFIG